MSNYLQWNEYLDLACDGCCEMNNHYEYELTGITVISRPKTQNNWSYGVSNAS